MKKFGIAILVTSIVLSSCGEKSVEDLSTERKEMIAEQKEAVREYEKALFLLDSTIKAHPDSTDLRIKVKTVAVTTDTVKIKTFEHFFEVHGNVEVIENAILVSEVPGTIKSIAVKEGKYVKQGDLIISIDEYLSSANSECANVFSFKEISNINWRKLKELCQKERRVSVPFE